jgi:hypothetical protein
MNKKERPSIVQDDHLSYLDALRESGVTNMFGASPYLVKEFGVSETESRTILGYWMRTFHERHQNEKEKAI